MVVEDSPSMGPGGEDSGIGPLACALMKWVMRRHISGGLEYMGKWAQWLYFGDFDTVAVELLAGRTASCSGGHT